jgi:hypothetical protein
MHDHTIGVPVVLGPLILRVILLVAVFAVAGFAMMRAFLGEPGRPTAAVVTISAGVAVMFEFMLGGALDFPRQLAILIIASLVLPVFLALSQTPGAAIAARHAKRAAPWIVTGTATLAFVEFARAWAGSWRPELVHTGIVLALIGMSWLTVGVPRARLANVAVLAIAAALATAAIGGAGYATAVHPQPSTLGQP